MNTAQLRPYRPTDLPGIYQVCREVDATGLGVPRFHSSKLSGHVYAGPYVRADPQLAFVVEDGEGVAGYVVATDDTRRFLLWLEEQWWPALRADYPRQDDPQDGTRDHALIEQIHAGPGPDQPWYATHPAHLHLKLATRLQRRGWGRRLMEAVLAALRQRGVPGVHLGTAEANQRAIAFYTGLGFTVAQQHPWGRTLVLSLDRRKP